MMDKSSSEKTVTTTTSKEHEDTPPPYSVQPSTDQLMLTEMHGKGILYLYNYLLAT